MRFIYTVVLFAVVGLSSQRERNILEDDHYVAAVVEYSTMYEASIDVIKENYVTFIRQATEQYADLVVFPEGTLTNSSISLSVPFHGLLQEFPVPALHPDRYDDLLVAISAAARENKIYVVINVRESLDCTQPQEHDECPGNRVYIFNTNVVFDRAGAVIDRYRKINLHREIEHTASLKPDLGIFRTDFGVTFGHFIGAELLFQVPAIQMVQKYNIKNIIAPTLWYSQMPFLTAIQIQESYAFTMDVNFLVAGAHSVGYGHAGSGIYSGKAGALISTIEFSDTKLLLAKVYKEPGTVDEVYPGPIYGDPFVHNLLSTTIDPTLYAHFYRPLVEGYQDITIVDQDVTCRFQVTLRNRTDTRYHYRAAAFSGKTLHSEDRTGVVRSCAIFFCLNTLDSFCGRRFPLWEANSTVIFEELTITGTVPTPEIDPEVEAEDFVVFPVTLTDYVMPLEVKDFTYSKNVTGNMTVHTMSLTNSDPELYSFGLWGRVFGSRLIVDPTEAPPVGPTEPAPGAGWAHGLSNGLLVMILAILINL